MSQEIVIRRAEPGDVAVLAEFNRAAARETEDKELIPEIVSSGVRTLIENPNLGFYVVAERRGEILGSLMITVEWSDWRNGAFWWIQSVYVRTDCRRQGVYRRLYQHVQSLAEQDQVCGFRLYADRENTTAQQTYKSVGMKETRYMMFEDLKAGLRYLV